MKTATEPFRFHTAAHVTQVCPLEARSLAELSEALERSSDASIFYHTFQSLRRYHFLTEGYSNDFAQWVLAACNRSELAERLASFDIRDYVSLTDLRRDFCWAVRDYCRAYPGRAEVPAFEPFYFLEAIEVAVPLGLEAANLREFAAAIEQLSHASIYFHFFTSRLRLHLRTNDFSLWLEKDLGLKPLADRINRIDIYTQTLEGVQKTMLNLIAGQGDS
jgi:hypothetical protein